MSLQDNTPRVSATVIAFNEEEDLEDCLRSLTWCHRRLRRALPADPLARVIRALDQGDGLLGGQLRARLYLSLVLSFRQVRSTAVTGEAKNFI